MRTIDLTSDTTTNVLDLFHLADQQNVLVRTPEGKIFVIAAVGTSAQIDDFAQEVEQTQQNTKLMETLTERSLDPTRVSASDARKRFGV